MMDITIRKTIYSVIDDYCIFSKPGEFIEIVEWTNDEGFDAIIETNKREKITMT